MARARELTTTAVLATLLASMAALGLGLILALRSGDADAHVVPFGSLPGALGSLDPAAWLSLGTILLLITPLVRLTGMLRDFLRDGHTRAALSAGGVLLMLTVALVLGLQGRKLGQSTGPEPAAVDSQAR